MKLIHTLIPVFFAALLVGCTQSSPNANSSSGSATAEPAAGASARTEPLKVGIVFDSGGRGDKSFNDSAFAGIERAKKEFGIEEVNITSTSEAAYVANLTQMANRGLDLVIAVGLQQQNALNQVAPKFPNVKFAIVDGQVEQPNVRMLKFREEQGSFLAGYLAGLVTKTNKIGFVGGMEIDLIKRFQYGYFAGAKMANPNVTLLPAKFTGDWNNSDRGKAAAAVLFSDGADIVYHAAGRSGLGVFAAAKEANRFAIGVDSDQDYLEPGRILTSMVKRVDVAVFQTIKDVIDGKFTAGEKIYDVASGGVGLTEFEFTKDVIGAANLEKLEAVEKQLASGEIEAPTNEEQFKAFRAPTQAPASN